MDNPHAKIEPISGILRVYANKRDDSVHNTGIPYLLSATVRWINPECVEILGLSSAITPSIWRAISRECWLCGIRTLVYYRYKNGTKIEKIVNLRKPYDLT